MQMILVISGFGPVAQGGPFSVFADPLASHNKQKDISLAFKQLTVRRVLGHIVPAIL